MKKVAIMIDGGFFASIIKKQFRRFIKPDDTIKIARHLVPVDCGKELFRIYYYDGGAYGGKQTNPVDHREIDFAASSIHSAIENYQRTLAETELVALRKGRLAFRGWKVNQNGEHRLRNGQALVPADMKPDFIQKAVDMKIGLDIAWISTKRLVDEIILVTADNDFIPAMKFARKEGLHVVIVNIQDLTTEMKQHADRVVNVDIRALLRA